VDKIWLAHYPKGVPAEIDEGWLDRREAERD